jgi:hypothetical protein
MLWLDSARHGIRSGGRLIRKSLLSSIATIVTLATGIGLDAGASSQRSRDALLMSSRRSVGVRCRGVTSGLNFAEVAVLGPPDVT